MMQLKVSATNRIQVGPLVAFDWFVKLHLNDNSLRAIRLRLNNFANPLYVDHDFLD